MPHKQKLSVEEKVEIVQMYLHGEIGITEAAQICGVNRTTMKGWIQNYEIEGMDAFLPHKNRVYSPELNTKQ